MYDFTHYMIWFGKKDYIRSHSFTVQFDTEEVSADAALTTLFDFKNETSAGLVQVVSDSGVEDFAGGVGGPPGGYVGVLAYEMTNLFRTGVTSVSGALFGGAYARSRYVFIARPKEGGSRRRRWESRSTSFVFDPASGDIVHSHEVLGDETFVKANDADEQARRFAGAAARGRDVITAPRGFALAPGADYVVDAARREVRRIEEGRTAR